jgi:hypothetical protein
LFLDAVYIPCYLALIIANYRATGFWPYLFLDKYGTDVHLWVGFVGKQVFIVAAFACINGVLMQAVPRLW